MLGVNIFKNLFANIRDLVGGRAGAYEKELKNAREVAMDEMAAEAVGLGAIGADGRGLQLGLRDGISVSGQRCGIHPGGYALCGVRQRYLSRRAISLAE